MKERWNGLISLFGRPGAGKTSLGNLFSEMFGFRHIPIGSLLRDRAAPSVLGIDEATIRDALATGKTLHDPSLYRWIDDLVLTSDQPLIVDGYPRTPGALPYFNNLVRGIAGRFSVSIVLLECGENLAAERVAKRARSDDLIVPLSQRNQEYENVQLPLLREIDPAVAIIRVDAANDLLDTAQKICATLGIPKIPRSSNFIG